MATAEETREFSSDTKDLGDKIAGLTLKAAKELSDYLDEVHGIKPAAGGAVMMAAPAGGAAAGGAEAAAEKTEISETLQDDFVFYLRRSPQLVEHFRKVTDNDIQLAGATTESGYLGSSGKVEIYSRCP